MPSVNPNESEQDYVNRAIPIIMEEGATDNKQAAAIAYSKYRKARGKYARYKIQREAGPGA